MKLFVGLGNPGAQYALNRHNVGFMAADAIAATHDFPAWRKRFSGLAAEGKLGRESVLLLKPQTYMNESGRSVGEAVRFYKLDLADVIVFHDELDLAPGKVRVKTGGGTAGHNGLQIFDRPYRQRLCAGPHRHRPSRQQGPRARPRAAELRQGRSCLARAAAWRHRRSRARPRRGAERQVPILRRPRHADRSRGRRGAA